MDRAHCWRGGVSLFRVETVPCLLSHFDMYLTIWINNDLGFYYKSIYMV